jgi:SAM-dependent methyltransferase
LTTKPPAEPPTDLRDYRGRIYDRYVGLNAGCAARAETSGESAPGNPYLAKVIRDHFPADRASKILDLGCGEGGFLRALRVQGYTDLAGIDRSPEQVAVAARRGEPGVRLGDVLVDAAALPDASHDVVIAFDVIEHLKRDELLTLADNVRRALRPGGRWVLHLPNAESPFFGRIRYGDITHEQAFTRVSLRQILLAAGFASVTCYEDAPVVHGVKSAARFAVWKMIRLGLRIYLAAETGETGAGPIFSQNLLAIAER